MNVMYEMGSAVIKITEPTLIDAQCTHSYFFYMQDLVYSVSVVLLKPNCLSFLSAEELPISPRFYVTVLSKLIL